MSDLKASLSSLRATPMVTVIIILSLAFGIGANTAIFSVVDGLLLRTLPVDRPEQLVSLESNERNTSWSYPSWREIQARRETLFDDAFAYRARRFNLSPQGEPDMVDGILASGNYFSVLGVTPIIGRTFELSDDRGDGGPRGPVVVIGHALWQRRFGGAADVVGKTLTIERVPFTIVGVMRPGFTGVEVGRAMDLALPIETDRLLSGTNTMLERAGWVWLRVLARLKQGQTREAAEQTFRGVQPHIREVSRPPDAPPAAREQHLRLPFVVRPAAVGTSSIRSTYRQPVLVMMTVVALVLAVACANIANLFLARAAARRREMSVRLALGASRWRLARQQLVEILLLCGAGALAGLWIAQWGSRFLVQRLSTQMETVFLDVTIDWRLLAFTTFVALAAALLVGLAPAIRAAGADPIEAMRGRGRGVTGDRRIGLTGVLVSGQVALSLVLVIGAGLFVRTFIALSTTDVGFDRDPVLVVSVDSQPTGVAPPAREALFDRVLEAARAVPGVAHASLSNITPVSGMVTDYAVEVENGRKPTELVLLTPGQLPRDAAYINALTPDWFATYGTRLVAGRDFDARDVASASPVAIVNETFVRRLLPDGSALGRRFRSATPRPGRPNPWIEIVGVAEDATYRRLRDELPPTFYVPIAQWAAGEAPGTMRLSVRAATGTPAHLSRSLADAIARIDPQFSLTFIPLARQIDDSLVRERLLAMLAGCFGVLALLLAALGVYGVTSYAVGSRRQEIGIRLALGARAGNVVGLMLRRALLLILIGVAAGACVALWVSRSVESLLYSVSSHDAATFVVASIVLVGVGLAAAWIPARRAARFDPARVLHAE
jgi:putative ABC transport system permease protein